MLAKQKVEFGAAEDMIDVSQLHSAGRINMGTEESQTRRVPLGRSVSYHLPNREIPVAEIFEETRPFRASETIPHQGTSGATPSQQTTWSEPPSQASMDKELVKYPRAVQLAVTDTLNALGGNRAQAEVIRAVLLAAEKVYHACISTPGAAAAAAATAATASQSQSGIFMATPPTSGASHMHQGHPSHGGAGPRRGGTGYNLQSHMSASSVPNSRRPHATFSGMRAESDSKVVSGDSNHGSTAAAMSRLQSTWSAPGSSNTAAMQNVLRNASDGFKTSPRNFPASSGFLSLQHNVLNHGSGAEPPQQQKQQQGQVQQRSPSGTSLTSASSAPVGTSLEPAVGEQLPPSLDGSSTSSGGTFGNGNGAASAANVPQDIASEADRIKASSKHRAGAKWTNEQDEALRRSVEQHNGTGWKNIAKFVPGRDHVQCLQRWKKVLRPGLVKGPWTPEEDSHLLELIKEDPTMHWGNIAAKIKGRTAKQCRERWGLNLDPNINHSKFTPEEDDLLMRLHEQMGSKWAEIKCQFERRTENAVKTRFKSLMRARARQWSPDQDAKLRQLATQYNQDWTAIGNALQRSKLIVRSRFKYLKSLPPSATPAIVTPPMNTKKRATSAPS
ncbi:Transcription factor MYB3R-5 [Hondaea fermentalgiana]|uniref:Transcription factor MYB3R-5 n=1 Tax=Hondaea fermentalgiana TaxID=2315210 RepID=A0A2R5GCU1_9STRA|nr:Transcription factor MYB3R-5 [Hondaea fermentalgiana]|eukprot:GBG25594.1 Transcription factor MYB3R-5 [Hondaea fermentalgiana]